MRYQGGKSGTGRQIAPILLSAMRPGGAYLEPFLGAAGVARHVVPKCPGPALLCDAQPDLILLWQELAKGWTPPLELSREEWQALRSAEPSALRAFAGFGCSFGGKWFGGYCDRYTRPLEPGVERSLAGESARALEQKLKALRPAYVMRADYRDLEPDPLDVIYCDPPYAGTTAYAGAPEPFDHEEFWRVALEWAETGARVFVSEHAAPEPWVRVWARPRTARMRGAATQEDGLYTCSSVARALDLEIAA